MIREATRSEVRMFAAIYGESGAGKTFTALIMARGMAGPTGGIVLVDSESGRGDVYVDTPPVGKYKIRPLSEPFTPQAYIDAIDEVEESGAVVGIIDSGSHEWEGVGGVLDMAADREEESKRAGLHNWKKPKFEHAKFVQRLMRSKIHWIICLRAKYKTRQVRDSGKTAIVKDDFTSPIQADDFIFECLCHGEVMSGDHSFRLTKHSHPDLLNCFPSKGPVTVQHGELIAKWCASGGQPVAPVKMDLKALKTKFWTMTTKLHGNDKSKLEKFLQTNGFLAESVTLDSLDEPTLVRLIADADKFL